MEVTTTHDPAISADDLPLLVGDIVWFRDQGAQARGRISRLDFIAPKGMSPRWQALVWHETHRQWYTLPARSCFMHRTNLFTTQN